MVLAGTVTTQGALLGTYSFDANDSASSLDASISSFSVFNANPAGGIGGSVITTSPGYYRTSAGWGSTFAQYIEFTVTPVSSSYISVNDVQMSVRQNDKNSTTTLQIEILSGATLIQSATASLPPGGTTAPFTGETFTFNPGNFSPADAGPLTFRIEATFNDSGQNILDFDSVSVNGSVAPVPEPTNAALALFACTAVVLWIGRELRGASQRGAGQPLRLSRNTRVACR